MTGNADGIVVDCVLQQVGQMYALMCSACHRQIEHLVEVAIIDVATPVNRNQVAAHDAIEVRVQMVILQVPEIAIERTICDKRRTKALNWHICENIESAEHNAVLFAKHPLIVRFQRVLRWWKRRTLGIVNEIEDQLRFVPIACRVEALETAY